MRLCNLAFLICLFCRFEIGLTLLLECLPIGRMCYYLAYHYGAYYLCYGVLGFMMALVYWCVFYLNVKNAANLFVMFGDSDV